MGAMMATDHNSAPAPDWIDAAGIRTRVMQQGAGIPVVFLHGGYAGDPVEIQSSAIWAPVFERMAGQARLVAIDRLGQGFTDNPSDPDGYTIDAIVDHVLATLSALDIDSCHIVGHDEGAFVGAQIAALHPDRVRSLTLVTANALTPGSDRRSIVHAHPPQPLRSRQSLRWIYETSCRSHLAVDEAWLDEAVAIGSDPKTAEAVNAMRENDRYLRRYVKSWTATRSAIHRLMDSEGLPCPTLVVWGLDDPIAPISNAEYLMELLTPRQRDTELRIFNCAGYYPFREHPAAFSRAVLSFVRDHDREGNT